MKENTHDLDQASYVFDQHPARFYEESCDNSEPSNDYDLSKYIGSTIAVHDHGSLSIHIFPYLLILFLQAIIFSLKLVLGISQYSSSHRVRQSMTKEIR